MANEVKKEQAAKAKGSDKAKKAAGEQVVPKGWVPNLEKEYKERIVGELKKKFEFKSVMQVPKLEKITINDNGDLSSWPTGVFSEGFELLREINRMRR